MQQQQQQQQQQLARELHFCVSARVCERPPFALQLISTTGFVTRRLLRQRLKSLRIQEKKKLTATQLPDIVSKFAARSFVSFLNTPTE